MEAFHRLFVERGLPAAIRSDNGLCPPGMNVLQQEARLDDFVSEFNGDARTTRSP